MKEKIKEKLKLLYNKYHTIKGSTVEKAIIIFLSFSVCVSLIISIMIISDIIIQPDVDALDVYSPTIPTKIFDINGETISEFFNEKRELVDYKDIPEDLIHAIVAMEDQNFFTHSGIDVSGILRATLGNLVLGKKMRGASTLTQQVARGIVLKSNERTIVRKFKEIWLSFQIERRYTKEEIVTFYFNQIFFGHSVYGVQTASRFYFNKDVQDLNLAECAMLATLPPSPNKYSPINNPNNSMVRHKVVLKRMIERKYITKEEAELGYTEFWASFTGQIGRKGSTAYTSSRDQAPYVTEHVRRILSEMYGEKTLKEGGLQIHTTIDLSKQREAQRILQESLVEQNEYYNNNSQNIDEIHSRKIIDRIDLISTMFNIPYEIGENKLNTIVISELNKTVSLPLALLSDIYGFRAVNDVVATAMRMQETELSKQVEGALVSMNPKNGYIVAMVGGSGFTPRNQLNRVVQARRQSGSAFKPFVYAYGLESKKFTLSTVIDDAPIGYPIDGNKYWVPKNYSGKYQGRVTYRRALSSSINLVTVSVLDVLGIDEAINYIAPIFNVADETTINRMFNKDLTLALGTGLFTPLEITQGYAVLANSGKQVEPILIRYVTDRYGVVVDNFELEQNKKIALKGGAKQVVSPEVAYMVSDMLTSVLRGGTATTAMYNAKFDRKAAGKTGTTSDWKDSWFVGYTPQLVTTVWLGFDSFDYSLGRNRASAVTSAPIWGRYMKIALEDEERVWFKNPGNIIYANVCQISGQKLSPSCISTTTEMFLPGTVPMDTCEICESDLRDLDELENIIDSFGDYNDDTE